MNRTPLIPLRQSRGSALIVAMAVVVLLAALSTVLLTEMQTRSHRVEVDLEDIKAFEAAEAGIDAAIVHINQSPIVDINEHPGLPPGGYYAPDSNPPRAIYVHAWDIWERDGIRQKTGCLGTVDWTVANDTLPAANLRPANYEPRPTWTSLPDTAGANFEEKIVPLQLGNVAFFTYAIDWMWDGIDNDLDGWGDKNAATLEKKYDINERNKYTIYSTGIHRGIQKGGITDEGRVITVEVIVQANDTDMPPIPNGALELQIPNR